MKWTVRELERWRKKKDLKKSRNDRERKYFETDKYNEEKENLERARQS